MKGRTPTLPRRLPGADPPAAGGPRSRSIERLELERRRFDHRVAPARVARRTCDVDRAAPSTGGTSGAGPPLGSPWPPLATARSRPSNAGQGEEHFVTGHPRQTQIEHHEPRVGALERLQRLFGPAKKQRPPSLLFEGLPQRALNIEIALHHEYRLVHRLLGPLRSRRILRP